jgi:hypothetical protein
MHQRHVYVDFSKVLIDNFRKLKQAAMKKIFFLLLAYLCISIISPAQNVGIGTTTPHPNAILELKSVNKGLLLPRGDANTRNPGLKDNTAKGLLLFDTLSGTLWVHNGDGTPLGWHEVQDDANGLWRRSGNDIVNNNIGNVGIGINSTLSRLYVNGLAVNSSPVIKSQVNFVGSVDVRGIEVMSNPNPASVSDCMHRVVIREYWLAEIQTVAAPLRLV